MIFQAVSELVIYSVQLFTFNFRASINVYIVFFLFQGLSQEMAHEEALARFPKLDLTRRDVLLEILKERGIDPEQHEQDRPKPNKSKSLANLFLWIKPNKNKCSPA